MKQIILALALFPFFGGWCVAQVLSSGGGTSADGARGSVQNQPENTTDTFAGLTFQIQRVIRDPEHENALRVLLRVIETAKEGRRVALIAPMASLVDEMGNVYYAAQTTGVEICSWNKLYDVDAGGCAYRKPNTPVILTPSQPKQVVALFLPLEGSFSPELAAMAETASFNARVAIYPADLSTNSHYDVVVNGIELPKEGS